MAEPPPRVVPLDRSLAAPPAKPLERIKAWAQDDQNWLLRPGAEANVERRAEQVDLGHRASWPGLLLLPLLAFTANGRLPVIGTAVLWADRALNRVVVAKGARDPGASAPAPTVVHIENLVVMPAAAGAGPEAAAPDPAADTVDPAPPGESRGGSMADLAQVLQAQGSQQQEIRSLIDQIDSRTARLADL